MYVVNVALYSDTLILTLNLIIIRQNDDSTKSKTYGSPHVMSTNIVFFLNP